MFEEERTVAEKVPVDGIQINDLNLQTKKKKTVKEKNFQTLEELFSSNFGS